MVTDQSEGEERGAGRDCGDLLQHFMFDAVALFGVFPPHSLVFFPLYPGLRDSCGQISQEGHSAQEKHGEILALLRPQLCSRCNKIRGQLTYHTTGQKR